MKNVLRLLRNLLYLGLRVPGKAASAIVAVIAACVFDLFQYIDKVLHWMVVLIGTAIVVNIIIEDLNAMLRRLLREGETTESLSRHTIDLLKRFLGISSKTEDTPENSKNTKDSE